MATTKSTNNQSANSFNVNGFVAVDATIKSFDKSSVARFPLSISRTEGEGDNKVRKSCLVNCEVWADNNDTSRFELLKKGQLVAISGYFLPEEYTDRNGAKQSRLTFRCTTVEKVAKTATPAKAAPKGKKAKAA